VSDAKTADTPENDKHRIVQELKGAGLLWAAGITAGAAVLYGLILATLPAEWSDLGEFGDSFGALTALFNALAFAALVATVVLQSRELRDTRRQLTRQADAAAKQLVQSERLEHLKVRPLIKAEWLPMEGAGFTLQFRMRNVGLGAAIVDRIDLFVDGNLAGSRVNSDDEALEHQWAEVLAQSTIDSLGAVRMFPFRDLNRALAPGEPQAVFGVDFVSQEALARGVRQLNQKLKLVIHFRSIAGERFSTLDQFNF